MVNEAVLPFVLYIYLYTLIGYNNDIWVWRILFHKVKIQVLKFSKRNSKFRIFNRSNILLNWSKWWRKIILESLPASISDQFMFDWWSIPIGSIKKSLRSMLDSSWSIQTRKTEFSVKLFSNCSKCLKMFQALQMVLWNILTFHMCFLTKYNLMGLNRGLCFLEIISFPSQKLVRKKIQEIMWSFSRITICKTQQLGCILMTCLQ